MIDLIRDNLPQIQELCRKHGVRRLFLVGSALGEGFDPATSDIDFVVDFQPGAPLGLDGSYFQMLEDLSSLLGRPIDLIQAHTLRNPYLIASLNRTKRMLYAA